MEIEVKVGPKGQVVIPKAFRDEFGIAPGDEVLVRDEKYGIVVKKPPTDAAGVLRGIAKSGKRAGKIDAHAYEKELSERWERAK